MNDFIFYAIIGVLGAALLLVVFWPEIKKVFGAKVSPRVAAELDREYFDLSDWWNNQADPMLKRFEERMERLIVRANSVIASNLVAAATREQTSPVAAAPIAAADSPAAETSPLPTGPAAPSIAESAAPSAIGGTPIAAPAAQQEKSMAYVPKYPPPRQAAAPSAILMLHGFKTYAALAQNFLDIPDEAAKFRYWQQTPAIWPLQDYLGISANWINALSYDGLADGVNLNQTHFDTTSGRLIVSGAPSEHPVLSWATGDGAPPAYYKPLRHVEGTGVDLLSSLLHAATQSAYLKSLGLTDEAIAAARA